MNVFLFDFGVDALNLTKITGVREGEEMKVLICGSRNVSNKDMLFEIFDRWAGRLALGADTVVITGGARGVDGIAREWCLSKGFRSVVMNADWDKNGKRAGYVRNRDMLELEPVHVLGVMLEGGSKGTLDMLTISKERMLDVKVVYVKGGIR
jgi:predicted Rossmann-fold nucleotide-binding protein